MIDEDEEYGLRCTVGQLESERDGYAGELTRMGLEVGLLRKKNVELLRANDRLRELVRDMWRDRDALSYGAAIPTLERMRELGVEVDDG